MASGFQVPGRGEAGRFVTLIWIGVFFFLGYPPGRLMRMKGKEKAQNGFFISYANERGPKSGSLWEE